MSHSSSGELGTFLNTNSMLWPPPEQEQPPENLEAVNFVAHPPHLLGAGSQRLMQICSAPHKHGLLTALLGCLEASCMACPDLQVVVGLVSALGQGACLVLSSQRLGLQGRERI